MKIGVEHLGCNVRYASDGLFFVEGFEREGANLFIYGRCVNSGTRPKKPKHVTKSYYIINSDDANDFSLWKPWPPEIERRLGELPNRAAVEQILLDATKDDKIQEKGK